MLKTLYQSSLFAWLVSAVVVIPAEAAITQLSKTPKIRVGLYTTDETIELTANYRYRVKAGAETIIDTVKKNAVTKITYHRSSSQYTVVQGDNTYTVDDYIRIVPQRSNQLITLTNYENRPSWNTTLNDNRFKGKVEIHYSTTDDAIWVVNILGLENYVKGVAEASDDNAAAYLRALYTAARTYAYWHYTHPGSKYPDYPFLLKPGEDSQIYRGWNFTQRATKVEQAVIDTRGSIVTYNNAVAITPYFSQSAGRTLAWNEVWSGSYDYLKSVDDPCCNGLPITGHGVGMSAKGARYFAEEFGWGWKKILQYYFTGVKIESLY